MTPTHPLEKNIEAVHSARQSSDGKRGLDQKVVMFLVRFVGTTLALYLHLIIFGIWTYYALIELHGDLLRAHVDVVSLILSAEAIFLAIFVLINQRHNDQVERKNADLHLQMSLVSEHKITQIARLLDSIGEKVGVDQRKTAEMDIAKTETEATDILRQLDEVEAQAPTPSAQ